jgi:DNA-binding NarL/FixJ family response regulator
LGLSARRVMVCWLLVMGLARKDIARRMGLGLDTVNEHVEAVFALLGVTSASDCIRAFSG